MKQGDLQLTDSRTGFTLIELMASVGVVALLVTLAVPTFSKYYKLARKIECQASIVHFLRAQDLYYLDNNQFYLPPDAISIGGGIIRRYDLAWNPANRPDQPSRYRFEPLGVEFRPEKYRGYRILVYDIDWGWLFWKEIQLQLTTDEDFDSDGVADLYSYRKYNQQIGAWGTDGQWKETNGFWFDIPNAL